MIASRIFGMMEVAMDQQLERIDRILSSEPRLTPSPRFTASVMDAVRIASSAPALTFPWKRFLLGVLAAALLGWVASLGVTGKLHWMDGGGGQLALLVVSLAVLVTFASLRLSNALSTDAG